MRNWGNPIERFWSNVDKQVSCWVYKGRKDVYGYGAVYIKPKTWKAHRFAYEQVKGKIPEGLVLDHLCRNNICVNPEHLEPKTIVENARRNYQQLKTYCPSGHKYSKENTHLDRKGARRCRICAHNRYLKLVYKSMPKGKFGSVDISISDD